MHIFLPDVRVFILKQIAGSYIRFASGPKIAGSLEIVVTLGMLHNIYQWPENGSVLKSGPN